jgi:hypothetical protein
MRTILLLIALTLGTAFAQSDAERPAPWYSVFADNLLTGGSTYCKASYDGGLLEFRSLCYAEYNLFQVSGLRVSAAARVDLTPAGRLTPLLLIDYTQPNYFAGAEFGYAVTTPRGWGVGLYFGTTLPAALR